MKFINAKDYQDMSRKAANLIAAQVIMNPKSVLGFATGSSPLGIYEHLIRWYQAGDVDFSEATSVNLDEYCGLLPSDPNSYNFFMRTNLFDHINLPLARTHLPNGTAEDSAAECARYDEIIRSVGGIDLQLLGIGKNAHIGFNEPNDHFSCGTHKVALTESTIAANTRFFDRQEDMPRYAYTVGMQTIMQARKILLVANGKEKAEALYNSLFGPITPQVPASILQLHPDVTIIADEDAWSLCHSKQACQ